MSIPTTPPRFLAFFLWRCGRFSLAFFYNLPSPIEFHRGEFRIRRTIVRDWSLFFDSIYPGYASKFPALPVHPTKRDDNKMALIAEATLSSTLSFTRTLWPELPSFDVCCGCVEFNSGIKRLSSFLVNEYSCNARFSITNCIIFLGKVYLFFRARHSSTTYCSCSDRLIIMGSVKHIRMWRSKRAISVS